MCKVCYIGFQVIGYKPHFKCFWDVCSFRINKGSLWHERLNLGYILKYYHTGLWGNQKCIWPIWYNTLYNTIFCCFSVVICFSIAIVFRASIHDPAQPGRDWYLIPTPLAWIEMLKSLHEKIHPIHLWFTCLAELLNHSLIWDL